MSIIINPWLATFRTSENGREVPAIFAKLLIFSKCAHFSTWAGVYSGDLLIYPYISQYLIHLTFQVRTLLLMMRRDDTRKCKKRQQYLENLMTKVAITFAPAMMMRWSCLTDASLVGLIWQRWLGCTSCKARAKQLGQARCSLPPWTHSGHWGSSPPCSMLPALRPIWGQLCLELRSHEELGASTQVRRLLAFFFCLQLFHQRGWWGGAILLGSGSAPRFTARSFHLSPAMNRTTIYSVGLKTRSISC